MIDYALKLCPFCGNPAEIVECSALEWFSKAKHVQMLPKQSGTQGEEKINYFGRNRNERNFV